MHQTFNWKPIQLEILYFNSCANKSPSAIKIQSAIELSSSSSSRQFGIPTTSIQCILLGCDDRKTILIGTICKYRPTYWIFIGFKLTLPLHFGWYVNDMEAHIYMSWNIETDTYHQITRSSCIISGRTLFRMHVPRTLETDTTFHSERSLLNNNLNLTTN